MLSRSQTVTIWSSRPCPERSQRALPGVQPDLVKCTFSPREKERMRGNQKTTLCALRVLCGYSLVSCQFVSIRGYYPFASFASLRRAQDMLGGSSSLPAYRRLPTANCYFPLFLPAIFNLQFSIVNHRFLRALRVPSPAIGGVRPGAGQASAVYFFPCIFQYLFQSTFDTHQ